MMKQEKMMNFEEAVQIVKDYSATGLLLDGLEVIQSELDNEEVNFLSPREIAAYRLVVREMRPLFN